MNAVAQNKPNLSPDKLQLARSQVKAMLEHSEAFKHLPAAQQQSIASNTMQIVDYLGAPDGVEYEKTVAARQAGKVPDPYALAQADENGDGPPEFTAQAAREGAEVAGVLLQQVNFADFVGGLINNVFQAIVDASIQQMEAYGELVASVAKSLNQFRDENVTQNQGRDHLVDQFPDLFQIDVDTGFFGETGPRVKLQSGVDEQQAAQRVNESLPLEGDPIGSLDEDTIERRLVPAARTQLATSRQQLLATMVLLGINRVIVTDGRISAKVLYRFKARDNFAFQRSATRFDYDRRLRTIQSEGEFERSSDEGSRSRSETTSEDGDEVRERERGAKRWAKGAYKYSSQPALRLAEASQEQGGGTLDTQAQLAGSVDINFKSETFPLDRMADSFQIGRIQNAAQPSRNPPPSTGAAAKSAAPPAKEPTG